MKYKQGKSLQKHLMVVFKKILKDNNAAMTLKLEKVIKKSIRETTTKSRKKIKK